MVRKWPELRETKTQNIFLSNKFLASNGNGFCYPQGLKVFGPTKGSGGFLSHQIKEKFINLLQCLKFAFLWGEVQLVLRKAISIPIIVRPPIMYLHNPLKLKGLFAFGVSKSSLFHHYFTPHFSLKTALLRFPYIILIIFLLSTPCCAETGKASFYGNGEKLNKYTANREVFNSKAMTCATYNYSFNTMLKVANLENNKFVIVRVNDRGPNKRLGRVIDLTKSAFERIANLDKGIVEVKIEVVSSPNPEGRNQKAEIRPAYPRGLCKPRMAERICVIWREGLPL